jgi:fermentation-respiration switch protein FrsA (DUF1100 family)
MQSTVTFKNNSWLISANLYFPSTFDDTQKHPAIICVHPGSSVKEQTAGRYAAKLAAAGYIALAYDASFQGESGGEPRYLEDPTTRVEDIKCAVDYLTTLPYIDNARIGILGICAGGGYAANAALTEKRIKAVGTISAANFARAYQELDALALLEAVGKQRTAEANGAPALITPWTPASLQEAQQAGPVEMDLAEAIDYYRTPRGEHPRSCNKLLFTSFGNTIPFDAFHLADKLLNQPLFIVVGDRVGAFGSYRDGFELYNKAMSKDKHIHVVHGASHYDLYDQPAATTEALEQLIPFFNKHL